jgi:Dyp-type peroxidase family
MVSKFEPPTAQRGISERPRQHLVLAALTLLGSTPQECRAAVASLRTIVKAELAGHLAPLEIETGELGYDDPHEDYQLIVTLAISTSGYDRIGAAGDQRPIDLHPAPADVLNPLDPPTGPEIPGEGDLLLHIASDDAVIVEHVLRRVEHELAGQLAVAWAQTGVQRYTTRQKGSKEEQRALIGFLDGTANLSMSNPDDRGLVYVDHTRTDYPANPTSDQYAGASFPADLRQPPAGPEPAILDGGTYVAVEVLAINSGFFDQQPVTEQERIVGRTKLDGAPAGNTMPGSHTLKSNPHRPGTDDEQRRILRRGYSLVRPYGTGLGRGLVFVGFARSLTTQLEFIRRAWINNDNFPTIGAGKDALLFGGSVNPRLLVGGYYFVPPLSKPSDPTSWVIPG